MSRKEPHLQEDVILAIREAWAQHPEYRLTPLLVNAIDSREPFPEVFSTEDSELIKPLQKLAQQ